MAYRAYEESAGSSVIKSVEGHCRHLTDGGTFSTGSIPTLELVEQWIDEGYADIQMHLSDQGYSTSIPSTSTAALNFLGRLNAYAAIMQVELSHPTTGRGEPNDRYEEYRRRYDRGVTMIGTEALSRMGVSRETELSAFVEVGGTSRPDKRALAEDSDLVRPRFERGFGRDPVVSETPYSGTP